MQKICQKSRKNVEKIPKMTENMEKLRKMLISAGNCDQQPRKKINKE